MYNVPWTDCSMEHRGVYMLIKVDNLVKSIPVCCESDIELPGGVCVGDSAFVRVDGFIANTDDGKYSFKGKVNADLTLVCDSCLEPFKYKVSFRMNEVYTKNESHDEDELHFTGKTIDLTPAAAEGVLLNLPMKAMCCENCRGLCRICGHNLNEGDCGCDRVDIDPRLEMLRGFINDKEV